MTATDSDGTTGGQGEVRILKNGPYLVEGIALFDAEGRRIGTAPKVALCRCGLSANKPFCDGSHRDRFEG